MVQFSPEDDSAIEAERPDGPPSGDSGSEEHLALGVSQAADTANELAQGRVFTIDSANRLLPLVSRIAQDLVSLSRNRENDAAQIRGIEMLPRKSDIRSFTEELDCVKESFRADGERLVEIRRELQQLGVLVDSLQHGAFDFPAFKDRRPIRLCWQIGESEIGFWHGVDESFEERRPIDET
jgi:hypothetical protein